MERVGKGGGAKDKVRKGRRVRQGYGKEIRPEKEERVEPEENDEG